MHPGGIGPVSMATGNQISASLCLWDLLLASEHVSAWNFNLELAPVFQIQLTLLCSSIVPFSQRFLLCLPLVAREPVCTRQFLHWRLHWLAGSCHQQTFLSFLYFFFCCFIGVRLWKISEAELCQTRTAVRVRRVGHADGNLWHHFCLTSES